MRFIHEDVTFFIIGDHPHKHEFCHPVGETVDTIHVIYLNGVENMEAALEDCPHGVDYCYVPKDNLQLFANHRKDKIIVKGHKHEIHW